MTSGWAAGIRYFAPVFAIGFALGTVRTLVLVPRFGALAAVAIELPLMLAASWWVCRRLVTRLSPGFAPRVAMGATAFAVLMATELVMSAWLFGRPPSAFLAGLTTPAGVLGLAGQVGFGLMPLFLRRS